MADINSDEFKRDAVRIALTSCMAHYLELHFPWAERFHRNSRTD